MAQMAAASFLSASLGTDEFLSKILPSPWNVLPRHVDGAPAPWAEGLTGRERRLQQRWRALHGGGDGEPPPAASGGLELSGAFRLGDLLEGSAGDEALASVSKRIEDALERRARRLDVLEQATRGATELAVATHRRLAEVGAATAHVARDTLCSACEGAVDSAGSVHAFACGHVVHARCPRDEGECAGDECPLCGDRAARRALETLDFRGKRRGNSDDWDTRPPG